MNTAKWGDVADTLCPVARSTAIVGERWTMLIVRELFAGCTRFDEIQAQTGATAQMLSTRLKQLEADGMIDRRAYSEHPVRYEYVLTPMGRDFFPVILALRVWGETWRKGDDEPLAIHTSHRVCGGDVGLDGVCQSCGEAVRPVDMDAAPGPEYAAERQRRQESHKTHSQRRTKTDGGSTTR